MGKIRPVFVFGSNEGGIHGGGAARTAHEKFGAVWGRGYGHMGDSFAIPTKGVRGPEIRETLPLSLIQVYVTAFISYANGRPNLTFDVTRIGCGLAGLTDEQIAPMFNGAPKNVRFDSKWEKWFPAHEYWGTF